MTTTVKNKPRSAVAKVPRCQEAIASEATRHMGHFTTATLRKAVSGVFAAQLSRELRQGLVERLEYKRIPGWDVRPGWGAQS